MKNLLLMTVCAGVLAGCVTDRAAVAQQAKTSMVGLSKESVLSCMGTPENSMDEGHTTVWTYSSGGGTDSFGTSMARASAAARTFGNSTSVTGRGYGIGSMITRNRYCVINVVFKDGRVSVVNYSGRTGGYISKGEQCAYAISNCVQ